MRCVLTTTPLFFHPGLNNEEYQVVIGNDTTRYIIDDLEPARNYTFYIVAYMPMGASRMSDHIIQHTLEDGEFAHIVHVMDASYVCTYSTATQLQLHPCSRLEDH